MERQRKQLLRREPLGGDMDLTTAVKTVFRRYAEFGGRSCRAEFWYFELALVLFELAYFMLEGISRVIGFTPLSLLLGLVMFVFALGIIVPCIAVTFRRLHDVDKSAWWLLLSIVPFGGFVLLYWYCQPGIRRSNRFGPDPLGPSASVAEQFS